MDQHKIPIEELFRRYGTNLETGLTDEQAKVRIEENGKNELTPPPQTPEWVKFCKQLFSGFALLLWVGGILCFIAYAVQSFQNPDDTPNDNLYLCSSDSEEEERNSKKSKKDTTNSKTPRKNAE